MSDRTTNVTLRDKIASLPAHERELIAERSADLRTTTDAGFRAEFDKLLDIRNREYVAQNASRYAHLYPKCRHCGSDLDEPGCSECSDEAHYERRNLFRRGE